MNKTKKRSKLPSTLPEPLSKPNQVVSWISELTNQPQEMVLSRLRDEYENQGINVMRAFAQTGLEPYVWNSRLEQFYRNTDAFLYELVVWNCNRLKRRIRKWIARYLDNAAQHPLDILCTGDGVGFDSVYLAQTGHKVTYFEVPGLAATFARKVFNACHEDINIVTDQNEISPDKYDVVICLDVLEHVPDPNSFVRTLTGYLRDCGKLIVHAPFYMIHPTNPTHLRSNRKYSGDLSLYQKHNLKLIDCSHHWNPLVLKKTTNISTKRFVGPLKLICIKLAGIYLSLGRFSTLPFCWSNAYRRKHRSWFGN